MVFLFIFGHGYRCIKEIIRIEPVQLLCDFGVAAVAFIFCWDFADGGSNLLNSDKLAYALLGRT